MNEFEMQRRLRALGGDREPQSDLWPGIAARIAAPVVTQRPRMRSRLLPFAAAAAVLLAVAAALVVVRTPHDPLIAATPAPAAMPHSPDPVRVSPRDIEQVARRHGTDPRVLDAAIVLGAAQDEITQAMQARPDAVFLVSLLNRTHAQRMKLERFHARAG